MSWVRILLTAGLAVPAVIGAIAATAAQGGRFSVKLDVLTHFAPIYLAVGLTTAGLGLALGRQGIVWVVLPGLLAALAAAALMAPEHLSARAALATTPGSTQGRRLTIVQFNAWGRNAMPDEAANWILGQRPDLVVLEEGGAVGARLAAAGGFHVTCPQGYATIYSRLPVASDNSPADIHAGRVLVSCAAVEGPDGPFTVFGVHRPWPIRFARDRGQASLLYRMIRQVPADSTLLIGDFNSTPWSFARRREDKELGLVRRTRWLFTWPAERVSHSRLPIPFALFPIDHVYAGLTWRTIEVRRGPKVGSDHYPVVVVLGLAATDDRGSA
jgi:endonuclease/exonuclease/phosphatase (EEP) superfamily protein YafD